MDRFPILSKKSDYGVYTLTDFVGSDVLVCSRLGGGDAGIAPCGPLSERGLDMGWGRFRSLDRTWGRVAACFAESGGVG